MDFQPTAQSYQVMGSEDRLYLLQTINALPPTQFNELFFALKPPKGVIPGESAPQGSRGMALLEWAEGSTGCGLAKVEMELTRIVSSASQLAKQALAFAISGSVGSITQTELQAIVQLLRKKTGDDSIDIAFYGEGSIKLVLNGSEEGLTRLQELFDSGELTEVLDSVPIEYVRSIESGTTDDRKAQLIEVLQFYSRCRGRARARNRGIDIALNFGLGLAIAIALDLALDLALGLGLTLGLDIALSLAFAIAFGLALGLAITHAHAIARARARGIDIALNFGLGRAHANAIALGLAFAIAFGLTIALGRALDLAGTRDFCLAFLLGATLGLYRATDIDIPFNFRRLDLSGANLESLDLKGVDLTSTDLTRAIVEGTIFGNNPGLTEVDKDELQRRGAIFQDTLEFDAFIRTHVRR